LTPFEEAMLPLPERVSVLRAEIVVAPV